MWCRSIQRGPRFIGQPMPHRVARTLYVNQFFASHQQSAVNGERMDVLFKGISAMKLTSETSLCVRIATDEEVRWESWGLREAGWEVRPCARSSSVGSPSSDL